MTTFRRRLRFALVLPAFALIATACSRQPEPQDILNPQGPISRKLDSLWNPVFLIAVIIFVLVEGLILFVLIRYRAKSDDDAPVQVHGNTTLEIGWTILPALLLLIVGFFTVTTLVDLDRKPTGDVLNVKVIGHQWWWEYDYLDYKVTTANELHIPVGQPVFVKVSSVDVIHSFWAPALAGKMDAVPGRDNHLTIQADKAGQTYLGQCTEYCGLSHANMRIRVVTHTQADFARWIADQQREAAIPTSGTAGEGASLFKAKGCGGCHSVSGYTAGTVGPNLTHLYSRKTFAGALFTLDEQQLRLWLRDPPGQKPMNPNKGLGMPNLQLTEDEIGKLIAFLETLH
ncbi:MAG TPA: cytochrome c oxidase subunit II [Acidimicrobiales bacterium]|nr:cytochrome c oxidase subunit II [Acidimicrobiales bacterium]